MLLADSDYVRKTQLRSRAGNLKPDRRLREQAALDKLFRIEAQDFRAVLNYDVVI